MAANEGSMATKILILLLIFCFCSPISSQKQLPFLSLFQSPWRIDQNQILVSPNGTFAAGFRPLPSTPQLHFFAIWCQNATDKTVVWAVNRDFPVNRSASLVLSSTGELVLTHPATGKNLWPDARTNQPNSTRLLLDDGGNLQFGDWMSFNHPTDTILPNQPLPQSGITLVSSRSPTDYASGRYKFINSTVLVLNQSDQYWTLGKFLNFTSDGKMLTPTNPILSADFGGPSRLRRLTLDSDGNLRMYSLEHGSGNWTVVWNAIADVCNIHGTCGPNFFCKCNTITNLPSCICPPGFRETPAGSCDRKIPLPADPRGSKFIRLDYVNFTGGSNQTDLKTPDFATCKTKCLANPRCFGFAYKYDGSQYCVHQIDRLLDGFWSPNTQTSFYLRVPANESATSNFTGMDKPLDTTCRIPIRILEPPKRSHTKTRNLAIVLSVFVIELACGVALFWFFLRRHNKYTSLSHAFGFEFLPAGGPKHFSYAELKAATSNFSQIIGEGGYGVVYKGQLPDGRVVAVKRLKTSPRSEAELWAEVKIIGRMHHLNLVHLWGFCTEKQQRLLVYEYVPHGSLDKHIFPEKMGDEKQTASRPEKPTLDWSIRYRIAVGVARAIAYLHEECIEWVLHCDIKPENILLEQDFCPKVSDFGLAKLLKKEDILTMSMIRGTRGYIAPEWLGSEPITGKADVYSFGVVLLEMLTGIRSFQQQGHSIESHEWYLPEWVFNKVYQEKNIEEILDPQLLQTFDNQQNHVLVDRMVKTAMWCLQDQPELRPSMGKVAKMLEGAVEIKEPTRPTVFYLAESSSQASRIAPQEKNP
ncbi:putative receptor protein kinase ZmPK1 [Nymphaea colorata]|uniref:putative receptor protein kinase ZmPK1 n=1 Tax=Nymphaea colorata TaxID=210225 RepID=UPI00129E23D2|nr:putative receptor protein kinase ZmPK1 [Nymphaea colorata]